MVIVLALAVSCGAVGCKPKLAETRAPVLPPSLHLLDRLLADGDVPAKIKAAEQDLPGDEWRASPKVGRYNASRSRRASEIAQGLLETLPARLKQMSAQQLVQELKVSPPNGPYPSFDGTAYYVYMIGDHKIMEELMRRPKAEVELLRGLGNDTRMIYTGESGGGSIGELVTWGLLGDRATNSESAAPHGTNL